MQRRFVAAIGASVGFRAVLAFAGVPFAVGAGVVACGRLSRGDRPVVVLAGSVDAQALFEPLRAHWNDRNHLSAIDLRLRARTFLQRFPEDPLAPLAKVYVALLDLESGSTAAARVDLPPAKALPPGDARDLATIARAKMLRLEGDPAAAFELLRPLVGKVVDADARTLFGEEIARAASALHRDYEAIAYVDGWLRSVDEDHRDVVRQRAAQALEDVSPEALQNALHAMRTRGGAVGYAPDTERLLVERLGAVAIARQDPALARWLYATDAGAPFGGSPGDREEALTELAASRRGLNEVTGRTFGLVLPTSVAALQDEAAEVMRGVAWGLNLSRSGEDDQRLVTRDAGDDPAQLGLRLDELAGDGAAIIVTGLDEASSEVALAWAEAHRIAVVVLVPPRKIEPGRYGFVAGESTERQLALLGQALTSHKVTTVAVIREREADLAKSDLAALGPGFTFGTPAACGSSPELLVAARYPLAAWRKEGVRAWLFDAPVDCAFGLARTVPAWTGSTPVAALTLQAAVAVERATPFHVLTVGAGAFPRVFGDTAPDPLAAAVAKLGRRPDWWTGVGHDVGALASIALDKLPLDSTAKPEQVAARRDAARDALAASQTTLWTTEVQGFAADHRLPRTLRLVEVAPRGR